MTDEPKRKVVISLIGHDINERTLVLEVPARWSDDDIRQLPGEDLNWLGESDWDVVSDDGVVVQDIRVEEEDPSDAEPDCILRGDLADNIPEAQIRLRLLSHVLRRMSDELKQSAGDALKALLSEASEEMKEELLRPIFKCSESWSEHMAKRALGLPPDGEHSAHDLLKRFDAREQRDRLALRKPNWSDEGL